MKKILITLLVTGIGLTLASLNNPTVYTNLEEDPDNCLDNLQIPQRFTPNGDTIDDVFIIDFPCQPESCEIQLFDMSGTEVYVTKTSNVHWDGNDTKGNPCPSGIYDWKVRYMYHMKYVERKGQTLLLR